MEVAQPVTFTKLFVVQASVTLPPATKFETPLIFKFEELVCVIFASVELTFNVVTLTLPSVTAFAVKVRVEVPEIDPLIAMVPDDEESELLADATETFPLKV